MKNFYYRVTKNDTVCSVANKFNLSTQEIIMENNLKKEIEEGDVLFLSGVGNYYVVKPTDTLCSVATKLGKTPEEIIKENQIEYVYYGLKIKK